jgi:hypothetical protein
MKRQQSSATLNSPVNVTSTSEFEAISELDTPKTSAVDAPKEPVDSYFEAHHQKVPSLPDLADLPPSLPAERVRAPSVIVPNLPDPPQRAFLPEGSPTVAAPAPELKTPEPEADAEEDEEYEGLTEDAEGPLPDGWLLFFTDDDNTPYYYDTKTDVTVWERPR